MKKSWVLYFLKVLSESILNLSRWLSLTLLQAMLNFWRHSLQFRIGQELIPRILILWDALN